MFYKSNLNDLAVFGGSPAFANVLHVGRPNIGNRQKFEDRVADILDRRWLSNGGRYVREFENRIAAVVGVKHCIVVTNATIALEIAARILDLSGEVIVPSFTFVATAHALKWLNLIPVFCDIDPQTYNIDPQEVKKLITSRTSAIMGVHVYGRPCDYFALGQIAHDHGLRLLYDAAHAFGCSYQNRMVGNFGALEVFSFHATKFLNSFEGGAIVTNDDYLAMRARKLINFGFADYEQVDDIGTNGKMNEVSAAMGLTNLESLDEFIAVNYRNYKQYQKKLEGIKGVHFVTYNESEKNNYQYLVLEIDEDAMGIDRDLLVRILHAENIRARRYFYPGCHRMKPYQSYSLNVNVHLPETEKLTRKVLQLPTGTALTEKEITQICDLIQFVFAHAKEIREQIA